MKSLESKFRAYRWSLGEKRRNVAELETLATGFRRKIEQLDRELEIARETAAVDPARALLSRDQVSQAVSRREKLRQSLKMLESAMVRALEEVDAAHQELRRFDLITSRNQQKSRAQVKISPAKRHG